MKLTSSTKLDFHYNIDEKLGNKWLVTLVDLASETQTENEDGIEYTYDVYRTELIGDEEYIKENVQSLLNLAKQEEYNVLAEKIREKRNKLLEESDKFMCLDRLNLDTSSAVKFLASLKNIFANNYAQYRQELRDITKQSGFPYDVKFPEKPE